MKLSITAALLAAVGGFLLLTGGCPQTATDGAQETTGAEFARLAGLQGEPGAAGQDGATGQDGAPDVGQAGPQGEPGAAGRDATTPSGFLILGSGTTAPDGYTYTGVSVESLDQWSARADMPTARRWPRRL